MTNEEFARLAEAWGADIARWPQTAQADAMRIAETHDAQAILSDQRRLDALLADAPPEVAQARIDRAIRAVVTEIAAERPRTRFADLLSRWLVPAAGFAAAAALGALIAYVGPLAEASPDDTQAVLTQFFDGSLFGQGWISL